MSSLSTFYQYIETHPESENMEVPYAIIYMKCQATSVQVKTKNIQDLHVQIAQQNYNLVSYQYSAKVTFV